MRIPHWAVLLAILVAAAAVRLAGSNWDEGYYLHPDERFMTMVVTGIQWPATAALYFDSATSPLNPFNAGYTAYVYGTVPLFLAKALGWLTGDVVYGAAHLPGRWLSAMADVGSVLGAWWIARRLFSPVAGLLAATLLAFTPLAIQSAHYFTTDSVAAFFAVAAFVAARRAADTATWRWYLLAGACVGLAAGSKPNLLLTAGFLFLPVLEAVRLEGPRSALPRWRGVRAGAVAPAVGTVAALLAALVAFRVGQPYAFLGPNPWSLRLDPRWTDNLDYWRQVQSGHIDLPPGVQWADRAPMLFILDNLVRWGMGPALGVTALLAIAAFGARLLLGRRWPSWWPFAVVLWVLFHLVFFGTGLVKAQRYLLPAYPFMVVLAAGWLDGLPDRLRTVGRWTPSPTALRRLRVGLIALVVAGTVFSGLALTTVYLRPQTRVEASAWIYDNVPPGSVLASEAWDDGLPLLLPDRQHDAYRGIQIPGYDADNDLKLSRLVGRLNQADYLIHSSDRLNATIPRMPDRYPMMSAYYAMLESGALGFEPVATFSSPPELFGIALDDRGAEESLTVYDHPTVTIYRKTEAFSAHDAWYLLDEALGDGGINRRVIDPSESMLMLDAEERAEYAAHADWAGMFADRHPALTVALWYLALQAIALLAVPLLWRLLPVLPDRGYALAKTIGVLAVGWAVWIMASLRMLRFDWPAMGLAVALVAALGVAASLGRWRELLADLRARWRWVVATEALFLVAFGGMLLLRLQNPDLWHPGRGGEKPMELAMFAAILRSPWFPPFDPWLAGGALHYYYVGYVPWAVMARLTGAVPELAFNLALPTLFGLLALNTWSAAAALLVRARALDPRAALRWTPILLALPAPVVVGVLGNLDLARRLGEGWWGAPAAPEWLASLGRLGSILWGIRNALMGAADLPSNAYWDPTRVIPGTINEFPYFSFLFADLHAHVLAMPVVAASIGVAVAIAIDPGRDGGGGLLATLGGWRALGPVVLLAFLCGTLLSSNSWDYPPMLALGLAAIAIRAVSGRWQDAPWPTVRDAALVAVVFLAAGRLFAAPFLRQFGSVTPQVLPGTERTLLADYLTIHGLLLVAVGGWLVIALGRSLAVAAAVRPHGRWLAAALAVPMVASVGFAAISRTTSAFLLAGLVLVAVAAVGQWGRPARLLLLAMTGLALGLALVPEHYRFGNDIGRMNLVFKLSLDAWLLLGIAATVMVTLALGRLQGRASRGWAGRLALTGGQAWLAAVAVLLIGAVAYPVLATPLRIEDRFAPTDPTLDGLAYMDVATRVEGPDGGEPVSFPLAPDRAAIDWLREEIEGSPVILEAQLPAYRWGGRVSSLTGLPTVLGWTWHQIQQRPGQGDAVNRRVEDVAEIYTSPRGYAQVAPLLDRYGVELIYVGALERALYPESGLAKFDAAAAAGDLEVVYEADGVTIYARAETPRP